MKEKVAFIGQSLGFRDIGSILFSAIEKEINNGYKTFIVSHHSEFDNLVLDILKKMIFIYPNINVELLVINNTFINKYCNNLPSRIKILTPTFNEESYQQKIALSYKYMINDSDKLICYINERVYKSGVKTALEFAKQNAKEIVNLYKP